MPDLTCPALLWIPLRITNYFGYGTFTLCRVTFQLSSPIFCSTTFEVLTPIVFLLLVWALAISLATTFAIIIIFFSFSYLDVSVH